MLRTVLKSKIHRATVTQADLNYVGSLTVDVELLEAADLVRGEQVHVVDVTNGARLVTYVIEGPRGSGMISANGGGARLMHVGDLLIVMAYVMATDEEVAAFKPRVVFVDERNAIAGLGHDLDR